MVGFWAPVAGPTKTVMHDFADGLAAFDRTDGFTTTNTPAPPNGTHAATDAPTSEEYLIALEDSLDANVRIGDVWYVPVRVESGAGDCYWGEQDTTPSNQYELKVQPSAFQVRKNDAGTDTTFFSDPYPAEQGWGSGEYLDCFIWWHPDLTYYDEPRDSDGSGEGDILIEVCKPNGRPIYSRFADVADLTFTNGGVGFAVGGGNEALFGNPEVGDPGAFDNFEPGKRTPGADEIHDFAHADLGAFGDNTDRTEFRFSDPGEFGTSPAGHDVCLVNPGGTGYSSILSGPSLAVTDQRYDLPRYLPDTARGRVSTQTDIVDGYPMFFVASDGTEDNCIRYEHRYDNGAVRVLEWVAGSFTEVDSGTVSWSAGEWYDTVFDRSTSGEITWHTEDSAGTVVHGPYTHTLDTGLVGNDSIGVAGSNSGGASYAFSGFRQY